MTNSFFPFSTQILTCKGSNTMKALQERRVLALEGRAQRRNTSVELRFFGVDGQALADLNGLYYRHDRHDHVVNIRFVKLTGGTSQ